MRTARHNARSAGPAPELRRSSRASIDSSQNVLQTMPSLGNQAMLRLSSSAPVVRRDTPPAAGKTAAPAAPAGPAPAPDAAGKTDQAKVVIPWGTILSGGMTLLDFFTPQVLQQGAGASAPATPKDPAAPGAAAPAPKGPVAAGAGAPAAPAPAVPAAAPAGAAPAAPSRLPLKDFGDLSVGLRLDFPRRQMPRGRRASLRRCSIIHTGRRDHQLLAYRQASLCLSGGQGQAGGYLLESVRYIRCAGHGGQSRQEPVWQKQAGGCYLLSGRRRSPVEHDRHRPLLDADVGWQQSSSSGGPGPRSAQTRGGRDH